MSRAMIKLTDTPETRAGFQLDLSDAVALDPAHKLNIANKIIKPPGFPVRVLDSRFTNSPKISDKVDVRPNKIKKMITIPKIEPNRKPCLIRSFIRLFPPIILHLQCLRVGKSISGPGWKRRLHP